MAHKCQETTEAVLEGKAVAWVGEGRAVAAAGMVRAAVVRGEEREGEAAVKAEAMA